ncbi:MAG: HEPN domain-containing protein [Spirochaetales bacterium]|nr:HEPN domain-containing protein [Spirochaetales bacterium]
MSEENIESRDKKQYHDNMHRAKDWFSQAENDLLWARDTLKATRYAQACFVAQQVAEKSLKALALAQGYDSVRSHSILQITKSLKINGEMEMMAKRLDQYYISARYPDAYIEGAPFEYFTEDQASEAVSFAGRFIDIIREKIYHGDN